MMLLQNPIATARTILNDAGIVTYTAADLTRYANDALDAILGLAPRWFNTRGTLLCTAGTTEQTLSFANAQALVMVERIQGGGVVHLADRAAFDRFQPGWPSDTAGPAQNWMPSPASPVQFSIYPKAPSAQTLELVYVRVPGEYADADETGLPDTLAPAVADYIVAMAMSRDDEHVNASRAAQFLQSFTARVGGAQ